MKILQVMAGNTHGGAETAFVDMCLAMHEAGIAQEVATRPNDVRVPPLLEAGLTVHTLPFGGGIDVYTPYRLAGIAKKFQPDIAQTWLSRGAAKMPQWKPSMGTPRYLNVARLGGYYKKKYFTTMDYFTTITPDLKRHVEESFDVQEAQVRHINNFAETEEAPVSLQRLDMGTPDDATVILGLGRLHPSKAFDTMIKVMSQLPAHIHLWIAGEGPQRGELEALIEQLDLSSRVKLLGWRSDRAALFQAADICFFCSRYEPFGTVFVQSWAQETPLIVTKADGPRQFVQHDDDGLLVDIDDEAGWVDAVMRMDEDKKLRKRLVKNGLKRYKAEFTKERCVNAYLEYYAEIRARENLV